MKQSITLEFDVPDGYNLVGYRVPKCGELYINPNGILIRLPLSTRNYQHVRPILEEPWEPEVGKFYQFSDQEDFCFCVIDKLERLYYDVIYPYALNNTCKRYRYCRPIPKDLIGK